MHPKQTVKVIGACAFFMATLIFSTYRFTTEEHFAKRMSEPYTKNATVTKRQISMISPKSYGYLPDDNPNRTWHKSGTKMEIYLYSAFYDDRESLHSAAVIRLVVVSENMDNKKLYCVINYPKSSPTLSEVLVQAIGFGVFKHNKLLKEYIYTCKIGNKSMLPSLVSIIEDINSKPSFHMPVEYPIKPKKKENYIVCVSITYWKKDPYRIIEWMELHKILGVSRVAIYNNSQTPETSRIFEHYAKEGFVDFRQSPNFIREHDETAIHLHMSPVINDCIYRNMHRFRKVLVTDLDEVIVPRKHLNYVDMVTAIEQSQRTKHPARSYVFTNDYFFLDTPWNTNESIRLVTLRHQMRLPPSPPGYSVKSMIDPQSCTAMHNHYCWGLTKGHDTNGNIVEVDVKLGMNQHYKKCHFDTFHNNQGECQKLFKDAVLDNGMLRFKEKLVKQVSEQLRKLDLLPL